MVVILFVCDEVCLAQKFLLVMLEFPHHICDCFRLGGDASLPVVCVRAQMNRMEWRILFLSSTPTKLTDNSVARGFLVGNCF